MTFSAKQLQRVLIMAGGTGGHVFPGLAIAKALQAEGVEIFWLGTARGLEAQLVPAAGIPLHLITVTGLRGKNLSTLLKAPGLLCSALLQSLKILRQCKPDVVVGMGGFASGPGGLAARLLRIPLIIHEQNAVAGLTNRLLGKIAQKVLTGFPGVFPDNYRAIYTGNPIRAEIHQIPEPQQRYQSRSAPLRLLVLGGSLGAAKLNELVPQAIAQLNSSVEIAVKHQTGQAHLPVTQANYQKLSLTAEIFSFIDNIADAYSWADVVLCRAGALTVTELAAAGVAAILVPFPQAVDDHQTKNGLFLVDAGAAVMVQQRDLSAMGLARMLESFANERQRLQIMAEAARKCYCGNAASKIVKICADTLAEK